LDQDRPISSITTPGRSALGGKWFAICLEVGVAVLILAVVAVAFGWTAQTLRESAVEYRLREVRAASQFLARSAESALRTDELTLLQQLVEQTTQQYTLRRCSVVFPKGQVLADSDSTRVTHQLLPASWTSQPGQVSTESFRGDEVSLAYPLTIMGRGTATLEVRAPIETGSPMGRGVLLGFVGIGVVGVGLWLVAYRLIRKRLRAMGAIRDALMGYKGTETPVQALMVASKFGPEAVAWNQMLVQIQKLRDQKLVEQTETAQGSTTQRSSELDEACNAMPQGLILVSHTLEVNYVNGAAATFAGADRLEMIDQPIDRFIQDANVLDAVQKTAAGTTRRRSMIEIEKPGKAGATMLRVSVRPVRQGDPAAVMINIEDITQQRVAEKSRNEFVAQVAHELRAPLTNIRLYVDSLLEDEDDPAQRFRSVNVINLETKRLTRLVSDMLSVAEIEAGSMQVRYDDIRLDEIFEELRADYQPQADEKNITLTLTMPPKVPVIQADRDKLMMALHNLVGNAVKYTPNGKRVDVSVEVDSDRFVMEVSDTGIGIRPDDLTKIFEKFYRAQDEQLADIPGTGLGLSLAREVMRLHGGDITVESVHGKGSTFTLLLPIQREAA